jgi:type IV secretion system protein TrbD
MADACGGMEIPVYRSLTEPILIAGAPRSIAILNGTMAAALGLGLQMWLGGLVIWLSGHTLAVLAARYDPQFAEILPRHLRHKVLLAC